MLHMQEVMIVSIVGWIDLTGLVLCERCRNPLFMRQLGMHHQSHVRSAFALVLVWKCLGTAAEQIRYCRVAQSVSICFREISRIYCGQVTCKLLTANADIHSYHCQQTRIFHSYKTRIGISKIKKLCMENVTNFLHCQWWFVGKLETEMTDKGLRGENKRTFLPLPFIAHCSFI